MKSQKDCWQALIDGHTLVSNSGVVVRPDKSSAYTFCYPKEWSIKEPEEPIIEPLYENEDDIYHVNAKVNEIIKHINGGE